MFNKYKNKKVEFCGQKFDSKLELKHYLDLCEKERARAIQGLTRQVKIKLGNSAKCKLYYIADFVYFDNYLDRWCVLDSKGFKTEAFKIKLKLLLDKYADFEFILMENKKVTKYLPYETNAILFKDFMMDYLFKKVKS